MVGRSGRYDQESFVLIFMLRPDGDNLELSDIGFYQHKNGQILGAEAQNTLGTLPIEILGKIKAQAKADGFKTLTLKFKRAEYDSAGKFVKYGEEVTKTIDLTKN